jgi:hypothetical protein
MRNILLKGVALPSLSKTHALTFYNLLQYIVFFFLFLLLLLFLLLFFFFLKGCPLCRLTQSSVLIRTHFHSNRLQNLFNAHVSVPVPNGRTLFGFQGTGSRIDAIHVDFGNETDFRGYGGVLLGTVNAQLIESAVVVGLMMIMMIMI